MRKHKKELSPEVCKGAYLALEDNTSYKPGAKDRIFLRIPTKIPATIFIDGSPSGKITVTNLSSTGLSLFAKKGVRIPDFFELKLRLPWQLRRIKIVLEVKNRTKAEETGRIGCRFLTISSKDAKAVSDYILRRTEFSPACTMFSVATFFLLLDALVRIFAWMISRYYREAHAEYVFANFQWYCYGITLILYAVASFLACLYSCDLKKKRFLLSLLCGSVAFLFILVKFAFYCKMRLWVSEHAIVKALFWIESLLLVYVAYAALFFASSLKKMGFTASSIDTHQKVFREKNI